MPTESDRKSLMHQETIPAHVFDTHSEANLAIQALGSSGFDVEQLALVGTRGPAVVAVGGIGVLHAALAGIGVLRAQVLPFEAALASGKFVLLVQGNCQEQARAAAVLAGQAQLRPG